MKNKYKKYDRYYMGLDLSLRNSGLCLTNNLGYANVLDNIKTESTPTMAGFRFTRYNDIAMKIKNIIDEYAEEKIDNKNKNLIKVAAIENYSLGSKGNTLMQLIESGSIVRWMLLKKGIKVIEVAPIQLKKFILGSSFKEAKGENSKIIMCREVYKKYNREVNDHNQIDALILSQIARLYYITKISKHVKVNTWYKYQIEVVESIINKEREQLNKYNIQEEDNGTNN